MGRMTHTSENRRSVNIAYHKFDFYLFQVESLLLGTFTQLKWWMHTEEVLWFSSVLVSYCYNKTWVRLLVLYGFYRLLLKINLFTALAIFSVWVRYHERQSGPLLLFYYCVFAERTPFCMLCWPTTRESNVFLSSLEEVHVWSNLAACSHVPSDGVIVLGLMFLWMVGGGRVLLGGVLCQERFSFWTKTAVELVAATTMLSTHPTGVHSC